MKQSSDFIDPDILSKLKAIALQHGLLAIVANVLLIAIAKRILPTLFDNDFRSGYFIYLTLLLIFSASGFFRSRTLVKCIERDIFEFTAWLKEATPEQDLLSKKMVFRRNRLSFLVYGAMIIVLSVAIAVPYRIMSILDRNGDFETNYNSPIGYGQLMFLLFCIAAFAYAPLVLQVAANTLSNRSNKNV